MLTTTRGRAALVTAAATVTLLLRPSAGFAQLNGQNIKGDTGLKSGSQAPPGTYVAIPLYWRQGDPADG